MVQRVQELIDKIKTEGIDAADKKAAQIEADANKEAENIVADAKRKADGIISDAQKEAEKTQEATRAALKQASRDMLLDLRKEILNTLNKVVDKEIKDTLTPDNLADIIEASIKGCLKKQSADVDIKVALSNKDLRKLKTGFIAKLQNKLKRGIEFQPSEDVGNGFTISFDGGKSSFDFTDVSLAEHLATYLNPEIASLLQKAVSSTKK